MIKVKASNIIQKATASEWPGTTIRMLKFPILRPSGKLFTETVTTRNSLKLIFV